MLSFKIQPLTLNSLSLKEKKTLDFFSLKEKKGLDFFLFKFEFILTTREYIYSPTILSKYT